MTKYINTSYGYISNSNTNSHRAHRRTDDSNGGNAVSVRKITQSENLFKYDPLDDIIKQTFNLKSTSLPTKESLIKRLRIDQFDVKMIVSRTFYTEHSFILLNEDFMKAVKKFVEQNKITRMAELNCGIGWLSFWMRKYNIPVGKVIDDFSWKQFKNHLPLVVKEDSIKYVKQNKDQVEMYILSWPYMDDVAYKIWDNMKKGQYLLYIGEHKGGCTANDKFFEAADKHLLKDELDMAKAYIPFTGVHDYPYLYQKQ